MAIRADIMNLAQRASATSGIPADWIYAQWDFETDGFTSQVFRDFNNLGGFKQHKENPEGVDTVSPEKDNYQVYGSLEECAEYAGRYLNLYHENGIHDARTIDDFAKALTDGGYHTDKYETYANGLRARDPGTGAGGLLEGTFNFNRDQLYRPEVKEEVAPVIESHWYDRLKDGFMDGVFDSGMGSAVRSHYLLNAYNPQKVDEKPKEITQDDMNLVNKMFPDNKEMQMFLLLNARNSEHLAALAYQKKQDEERSKRIQEYGVGLATAGQLVGSIVSDPTTFVPFIGQEAILAKGLARMGKVASAVSMHKWAKYAEIAATTGALNVADRYGAEKIGGFQNQDYTQAFMLGTGLGGVASMGIDVFKHVRDKGAQKIVASLKNNEDHIAAQATGAPLPNAVKPIHAEIAAAHDASYGVDIKSDHLKSLTDNGKVYALSLADAKRIAVQAGEHIADNAKAFYSPEGFAVLIKDNIKAGDNVDSLLLHEVGVHGGMRKLVGEETWSKIMGTVEENVKNPKGLWKQAVQSIPDGGLEEILGAYVELAGTKKNWLVRSILNGVKTTVGGTEKLSGDQLVDLAKRALKREVELSSGSKMLPDGTEVAGGLRFSANNTYAPNLLTDVIRTEREVLHDEQGWLGRAGRWLESGNLFGTLGGITRNSQVRAVSDISKRLFHDARMRVQDKAVRIVAEKQKEEIMQQLSVPWNAFLDIRSKYIHDNAKGLPFEFNLHQKQMDFNKEVYECINAEQADHMHNKDKVFTPEVKQAAAVFKQLYDQVAEIGKKSANMFGFDHPNMLPDDWAISKGEVWRHYNDDQWSNALNHIFGGYDEMKTFLADYAYKAADRPQLKARLLKELQEKWDIKKAEHDAAMEKYKDHMGEAESGRPVTMDKPRDIGDRPVDVEPEVLDKYIKKEAHDYAFGMVDRDASRVKWDQPTDTLNFFRQRFPMDTSMVVETPKGIPFSYDMHLREYNLDHIVDSVVNRFSGEVAFKNAFPDGFDNVMEGVKTTYQKAINNKETGITEATRKREMDALTSGVNQLRGLRDADDVSTIWGAIGSTLRNASYGQNGANMGWNQVGESGGAIGYAGLRAALHVIPALDSFVRSAIAGVDNTNALKDVTGHVFGQNTAKKVWSTSWESKVWHQAAGMQSMFRHMDHLNTGLNVISKLTSTVNLMPRLTDWMVTGSRAEAIADSVSWAKGAKFGAWRNPFSKVKLDAAGVDAAMSDKIKSNILKYTKFNSKGYMSDMNVEAWQKADPDSYFRWKNLMDNQSMRMIQQHTIGNKAFLTDASTMAKILFQFKDFSMKAVNGQTLRALTSRERDDVLAAVGSMATNAAVYAGLTQLKSRMYFSDDKQKRQEYLDKQLTPGRLASAAVLRGVLTGSILSMGNDLYEAATGSQSFRTTVDRTRQFGKPQDTGDKIGNYIEQVPAVRTLTSGAQSIGNIGSAISPIHDVTKREFQAGMKAVPLQNAMPMMWLTSQLSHKFPDKDPHKLQRDSILNKLWGGR